MLAEPQEEGLFSSEQIREYIGQSFRERVRYLVPEWYTNQDICDYLIRKTILVHLEDYEDKFNLVCFMIKKLFQLVSSIIINTFSKNRKMGCTLNLARFFCIFSQFLAIFDDFSKFHRRRYLLISSVHSPHWKIIKNDPKSWGKQKQA